MTKQPDDTITTRKAREQAKWAELKQLTRKAIRARAVVIPPRPNHYRGAQLHDCPHTKKHHKASGRCRKGCDCTWGADKASRKARATNALT